MSLGHNDSEIRHDSCRTAGEEDLLDSSPVGAADELFHAFDEQEAGDC